MIAWASRSAESKAGRTAIKILNVSRPRLGTAMQLVKLLEFERQDLEWNGTFIIKVYLTTPHKTFWALEILKHMAIKSGTVTKVAEG